MRWLSGSVIRVSFSVRKQPPPSGARGSPVETSPHRTPVRSDCPATESPHRANIYPSALLPSPPRVPLGPENTCAHMPCVRDTAHAIRWSCQNMAGAPSTHLISNEELVVDGEGHGVSGTEPPHGPIDGVSCHLPLLCILFNQRYHIPLVPR